MEIKQAKYLGSWQRNDQMPHTELPEFAFIGRSNVGKSSLINMLTNHKGLAKTSSTPGKTQSLNLFLLEQSFQFCDLPGYGYAKVGKATRQAFSKMIEFYLKDRPNLYCLFILVDLRISPQAIDIEFINKCGEWGIPLNIVGTKADKLKAGAVADAVEKYKTALSEHWYTLPPFIVSSSEDKIGKNEIWQTITKAMLNNPGGDIAGEF